jgi:hypothetical protein
VLALKWPDYVAGLLRQQVKEPLEEIGDRAAIPALTPVDNSTSVEVMRQTPSTGASPIERLRQPVFYLRLRRLQSLSVSLSVCDFSSDATPSEAAAIRQWCPRSRCCLAIGTSIETARD